MTLLAVNLKGRWCKELGLGTNLLVTILLVTLSLTDIGLQRGGGGENGVQVWLHLPTLRKVGLNIPIRVSGGWASFYTSVFVRNDSGNAGCHVTMPQSKPRYPHVFVI